MTNTHDYTERLSALLDGDLDGDERADLEGHLLGCGNCRRTLDHLRAIVAAAPGYQGEAPAPEVWQAIAAEIEAGRTVAFPSPRRPAVRWSWPTRLAASLGLVAFGAGGTWLALRSAAPGPPLAVETVPESVDRMVLATQAYDAAVVDLQRTLDEGRDLLAPETVATIERSLAVIDQAIAEAEAALAADPTSPDLPNWIAANQRRKLDFLRRAAQAVVAARTES